MLKSSKIFLRKVQSSDAEIILKWENNPDNWEVSNTQEEFTRQDIENFVNQEQDLSLNKQLRLMILSGNSSVGCLDLFEYDTRYYKAGVGILIDNNYRNKGIATKALALLVDYCRNELNIVHLFCYIHKDNLASIRLFEKSGFDFIRETELDGKRVNYYEFNISKLSR